MAFVLLDELSGFDVPDDQGFVGGAGEDVFVGVLEREAGDGVAVAF